MTDFKVAVSSFPTTRLISHYGLGPYGCSWYILALYIFIHEKIDKDQNYQPYNIIFPKIGQKTLVLLFYRIIVLSLQKPKFMKKSSTS